MKVLQKEIQLWIIVEIMYKFFNGIRSYCSRLTFIQQAFLRSTIYSRNNLQTVRGSRCYATSSGMLNECINFTMCRFVFVMIYNCEINYQLIIICYLYLKTSYLLIVHVASFFGFRYVGFSSQSQSRSNAVSNRISLLLSCKCVYVETFSVQYKMEGKIVFFVFIFQYVL